MATLTSQIEALIAYANETTGKADTSLGDAVKSLADGYKGGGVDYPLPTITDAELLSSKITALVAYANSITGKADATIGDAVRSLVEGYGGGGYINFVDPEVFRILMKHGVSSDGIGITTDDWSNVTTIGTWFKDNTAIRKFPELGDSNIQSFQTRCFYGCTSLEEVRLPYTINTIPQQMFQGCVSLKDIVIPSNITNIGSYLFSGAHIPDTIVIPSSVKSVGGYFAYTAARSEDYPSKIYWNTTVDVPSIFFNNWGSTAMFQLFVIEGVKSFGLSDSSYDLIDLPSTIETISGRQNSSKKGRHYIIIRATTPPDRSEATNNATRYYVPDESVDAYKDAGYGNVYPLSSFVD